MQLTIVYPTEPVYRHYDGQSGPQPCHVEVDTRNGRVRYDYDPIIGPGTPMDVYYGVVQRWTAPSCTPEFARTVLDEVAGWLQRVVDGASYDWDGRNHLTVFTDDAASALAVLDAYFNDLVERGGDFHVWDASDWYAGDPQSSDRIAQLVRAYEAEGLLHDAAVDRVYDEEQGEGDESYPFIEGLRAYIEQAYDQGVAQAS